MDLFKVKKKKEGDDHKDQFDHGTLDEIVVHVISCLDTPEGTVEVELFLSAFHDLILPARLFYSFRAWYQRAEAEDRTKGDRFLLMWLKYLRRDFVEVKEVFDEVIEFISKEIKDQSIQNRLKLLIIKEKKENTSQRFIVPQRLTSSTSSTPSLNLSSSTESCSSSSTSSEGSSTQRRRRSSLSGNTPESPHATDESTMTSLAPILDASNTAADEGRARVFLQYEPLRIANTLTILNYELFLLITPQELLNCSWQSSHPELTAPNLSKLSDFFNRVATFVAMDILYCPDRLRASAITAYIQVAGILQEFCDLQSLQAVIAGLNHISVIRLKNCWDAVSEKHRKMFKRLDGLLSPTKGYSKYKKYYTFTPPPKMPCVAIMLKEVKYLYENKKYIENDIVNYRLILMLGERLAELKEQQGNANFHIAPLKCAESLATFFMKWVPNVTEEDMYKKSLEVFAVGSKVDLKEPRQKHTPKYGLSDEKALFREYSSLTKDDDTSETTSTNEMPSPRMKNKLMDQCASDPAVSRHVRRKKPL